jgi:hypothetical protein
LQRQDFVFFGISSIIPRQKYQVSEVVAVADKEEQARGRKRKQIKKLLE